MPRLAPVTRMTVGDIGDKVIEVVIGLKCCSRGRLELSGVIEVGLMRSIRLAA